MYLVLLSDFRISMIPSRFLHVVKNCIICLFYKKIVFYCAYVLQFFVQFSVLGHLGGCQIGVIVTDAAMNIESQISSHLRVMFLGPWGRCQERVAGSYGNSILRSVF